ncbi:MAG: hypothetical protein ACYS8W_16215 [Planctomycetota bacterium]|jgi:hypothetical protein
MRGITAAFFLGLVVGSGVACLVVLSLGKRETTELHGEVDRLKTDIAVARKKIAALDRDVESERTLRGNYRADLQKSQETGRQSIEILNNMLKKRDAEIAKLKEYLAAAAKEETGNASETAQKEQEQKSAEERMKEAMEQMDKMIRIGEGIPGEAAKDLGLDEESTRLMNEVLADEAKRMKENLEQFLIDSNAQIPADWDEKDVTAAMMHAMGEAMKGGMPQFSAEDRKALLEEKKTITDILESDHPLLLLGKTLHEARNRTYGDASAILDEAGMKQLKENYLSPGDFFFKGNLQLAFGNADWSKVGRK